MLKSPALATLLLCSFSAQSVKSAEFPARIEQRMDAARKSVSPAVVFIHVRQENNEQGRSQLVSSQGSGVLISNTGEVLTNWHVINHAKSIRCQLSDGTAVTAQVIGSDQSTDLALLKLDLERTDLPFAEISKIDQTKAGDFVLAMGAPWGLSRSISLGIISCAERYLPSTSQYSLWLQTDAAISPGNSGGPLVDLNGKIIGINTRGSLMGGDLGFAIPAQTIRELVPRLREYGEANWSWLGLELQAINDFSKDMYYDPAPGGVIISGTEAHSPARNSELQKAKRLLKINGEAVHALSEESLPAIRRKLALLPANQEITLEVLTQTGPQSVKITPIKKADIEGKELEMPLWDFTAKTITQFKVPHLYFQQKQGVYVFGLAYPGNAMQSGLKPEDIIIEIDHQPVASLSDLQAVHQTANDELKKRRKMLIKVLRGGTTRQIILDYSTNYETR